jgi:hypothetical protein
MFLFTGLAGLGILCVSARTRSTPILWFTTLIISFAASLRILTALIIPIAVVTGIYMRAHENKEDHDRYLEHLYVCLAIAVAWVSFHYLSIQGMTGKGWMVSNPVKTFSLFLLKNGLS